MLSINVDNKIFVEDVLTVIGNGGDSYLPNYLNETAMRKDLEVKNALAPLLNKLQTALTRVNDLDRVAGHESYAMALGIYKITEAAAMAGVPDARTAYESLKPRFERQGGGRPATNFAPPAPPAE
ncbi:hypothetical protein [Aequorivita echinoideorum]|uniref:Uncharacterized protein n=1 Tax=Aequorivita echinoideorum TaxID=1549647 RepID=A0ABS5S3V9_9FLAO|nr:hypothetical protein [Aequorivita echinoideorum]MBT0607894.1 hypothetical protein [Aequorivita echinoideorum]